MSSLQKAIDRLDDRIAKAREVTEERTKAASAADRLTDRVSQVNRNIEDVQALRQDISLGDATLVEVQKRGEALSANIADLILGLEDITNQFQAEFKGMQSQSTMVKLIGIIAPEKAKAMHINRIRQTSIDGHLNELIRKSNVIQSILESQLAELRHEKQKTDNGLEDVIKERLSTVDLLGQLKNEKEALMPQIEDMQRKVSEASDPSERSRLEQDLVHMNQRYNEVVTAEQTNLVLSQTYERYIEMFKVFSTSLQEQISSQETLIAKLETDTRQRSILYDATVKSLKTASQQEAAHRISNIGDHVDAEAVKIMASVGEASRSSILGMMEVHPEVMQLYRKVEEEKAKVDADFKQRFQQVVREHDSAAY